MGATVKCSLWYLGFFRCTSKGNSFYWLALASFDIHFGASHSFTVLFCISKFESRRNTGGGTGWNVIKNFAFIWTLFIVFIILLGFFGGLGFSSLSEGGADQAVVIVGLMAFGFIMMVIWFCVAVPMLVLGLYIKQSCVVERGPTGPLKNYHDPLPGPVV